MTTQQIKAFIDEISKVDQMIDLHRNADNGDFMINQYHELKNKMVIELVDDLILLNEYDVAVKIIYKFYADTFAKKKHSKLHDNLKDLLPA